MMLFNCPRCKKGKIQYRCRPDETEEERFRRLYYIEPRSDYVMFPDYIYSRNCLECDWNETITKETFELAAQELGRLRREKKNRASVRPLTFNDLQVNQRFRLAKFPEMGDWIKVSKTLRSPWAFYKPYRTPSGNQCYATHSNEEVILLSMQNNDQPMPTKTDEPFTHDLVAKDVEARKQLGIKKYGVALQPNNGRDSLQDAYEECLDLVVYLRNQIAKNASEGSDAAELAVMRGRYNAALSGIVKQNEELAKLRANPTQDRIIASQSAALVKASEDVERLKRDNERLSTQLNNLNQLNLALREERKWPSGFWNVINQAFLKGWEWRSLNRPEDVTKKLQEARHAIRVIFYQEKFPEE